MARIPPSICEGAQLADDSDAPALIEWLRNDNSDLLDGLLSSDDSIDAADRSLVDLDKYSLRIVEQVSTGNEHKFCSFSFDGQQVPTFVGLFGDTEAQPLPTDLETLVFWGILCHELDLHSSWRETPNGSVVDWRNKLKGRALIASPKDSASPEAAKFLSALFTLEHPDLPFNKFNLFFAAVASNIKVNRKADQFDSVQIRLLFEATAEKNPKWRALSLYRILENAYINNIKQELLQRFDRQPKFAIDEAKKQLGSEVNQLVTLADSANLQVEFADFDVAIDTLLAKNNKFVTSMDREASDDPLYKVPLNQRYKKGVLRLYKLRCAIAHAGTASVIYEQFDDADNAAMELMPTIEQIVLKLLKIAAH